MNEDIKWVIAVLRSSCVRVDQNELHTRLDACLKKLEDVAKEMENNEADNEQE